MENQTVVSTMSWPWIAGNLSVVSIPLLHGKSNRCFNNILPFQYRECYRRFNCRQSICRFNSFLKWEISPLFQQFFCLRLQAIYLLFQFFCQTENLAVVSTLFWLCTVATQSVVSNLLSNGKSNRCFNTFLSLHFR